VLLDREMSALPPSGRLVPHPATVTGSRCALLAMSTQMLEISPKSRITAREGIAYTNRQHHVSATKGECLMKGRRAIALALIVFG
jgi:hypothetical protein